VSYILDVAIKQSQKNYVVLKIESYQGEDTFLRCGDEHQDYLYAVVAVEADGSAGIVDSSYRSMVEALEAWPEALVRPLPNPLK
jgi:hypothetical protein